MALRAILMFWNEPRMWILLRDGVRNQRRKGEGGREGDRKEGRKEGREEGRKGGRKGGRKNGREGGREGGRREKGQRDT